MRPENKEEAPHSLFSQLKRLSFILRSRSCASPGDGWKLKGLHLADLPSQNTGRSSQSMAMTNPSETQANRRLQAPIRLPSHCTIPLILSEWSPFPGSQFPVVSVISRGSCFSCIPHSCKAQPSSPQNRCSWPRCSLLHARSAALRHYWQLGLGHSVVGTILCAVGCLGAPLVPVPWMSVASPRNTHTSHANQSCPQALPKAPGGQDHSAWEPPC